MKIANVFKKICLFISLITLMLGVCGCMDTNQNSLDSDIIQLTPRQIEILQREGLPTDISKLTQRQKKSIKDIEEMLQYAENKYGIPFIYVDYTAEKELESGVLTAYPSGSLKKRDIFSIRRGSDGGFEDTYNNLIVRDKYEEMLHDKIKEMVNGNFKSYAQITETALQQAPLDIQDCVNTVKAKCWIFVEEKTNDDCDNIVDFIISWMNTNKIKGSIYILSVTDGILQEITEENFTDYLSGNWVCYHKFENVM